VPMIIGGTGELYRGRKLVLRVLPATTAQELAGLPASAPMPEPNSAEERAAAHRIAGTLAERLVSPVATLHAEVERAAEGDRKRWRWLTNWLDWDADAADAAHAAPESRPDR